MATQLQLRRGTNTQMASFTGAEGELAINTTNDSAHVHDGSTAGGHELARADFNNISASATLTLGTLNTTNLDLTNLEVTNIKAKDGTAAGSIADSTGVVTITSQISFADNSKAVFGDDSDLQIYHTGAVSVIEDSGTGNLLIRGTDMRLQNAAGSANYLKAVDGAEVELMHGGATKLATTSTGIDVTGDITLGDTNPVITFNDSSVTNLSHTISSSSDNLKLTVDVNGVDSGSRVEIYDGTTDVARFAAAATIFNEGGANQDFRIESNSNSHMLFVDGGNNRVGIGTSNPTTILELKSTSATAGLSITGGNSNTSDINLGDTDDINIQRIRSDHSDNSLQFTTNNSTRVTINSSGFVGMGFATSSSYPLEVQSGGVGTVFRAGTSFFSVDATGSASSPSLVFNGDTDTGFYRSASDTISFASAGVDKVTLGASGLDVTGRITATSNHSQLTLTDSDDSKFALVSYSGGKYIVRSNSTDTSVNQFTLTEDGNFGIGTISPSNTLDVNGSASFGNTSTNDTIVLNGQQDGTVIKFNAGGSHRFDLDCHGTGTDYLSFNNTNANRLFTIYRGQDVVVNEDSLSTVDFRVESDSNSHMLFVDAANNRVGIGISSGLDRDLHIKGSGSDVGIQIEKDGVGEFRVAYDSTGPYLYAENTNHPFRIYTGGAQTFILDEDGHVGVGTTEDVADSGAGTTGLFWNGNRLSLAGDPTSSADAVLELNKTNSDTSNNNMLIFALDGVFQGDIDLNGGLVRYNQSSDYRLKENVVTEWDATTRLKQLKPSRFNFINHPNNTIDGFLAHEVSSIVPEAISGDKDAVDNAGNPIYQGIDQSKLVPLLVKTIQELEARITTLEGGQ